MDSEAIFPFLFSLQIYLAARFANTEMYTYTLPIVFF